MWLSGSPSSITYEPYNYKRIKFPLVWRNSGICIHCCFLPSSNLKNIKLKWLQCNTCCCFATCSINLFACVLRASIVFLLSIIKSPHFRNLYTNPHPYPRANNPYKIGNLRNSVALNNSKIFWIQIFTDPRNWK